jgi:cytosine/adenosine deaminase-related metal-dependent hydrolase
LDLTVIRSATIITGDREGTVLHDAAAAIDGARIAVVGPSNEILQRYPAASIVDGKDKALAPGLANCHNHLSRALARGVFEDQNAPNRPPYSRKGFLSLPEMTPEERDAMVQLGVAEAIRSGTTMIIEVASGISQYADLLAKSGLRFVLAEQVADRAAGARVGGQDGLSSMHRSRMKVWRASRRCIGNVMAVPMAA